jgi:hypothetical protein
MLSRRHRTAAAALPITRCEHPLLAAAGASTSLLRQERQHTSYTGVAQNPDQSFLWHPGDAQAGKINVFVERTNLRHPQIFSTQMGDARIMIVATKPARFGEFRCGACGFAFEGMGGRQDRQSAVRLNASTSPE